MVGYGIGGKKIVYPYVDGGWVRQEGKDWNL